MLSLPVLDDKTADRMVEEAVARIPTMTRDWTDFNEHDTGILLLETFAAFAEMQNYYLDQVGERFLDRYLTLAGMDKRAGEPPGERAERFARECQKITRAVTASDYEQLALGFEPSGGRGAEKARAVCADGRVLVTVYRAGTPFSALELAELRAHLEPFRLLTVRLEVSAAVRNPVRVRCRVELAGAGERLPECRTKIREVVERYVDGGIGAAVNLEGMRLDLLALSFVQGVPVLELVPEADEANDQCSKGLTGSSAADEGALVELEGLEIDFS